MAVRICWNRSRGTITSAIWKVIERPSRTILAPIFTNRSRSVVIDHCATSAGSASVRRKLGNVVGQCLQLQPHGLGGEAAA